MNKWIQRQQHQQNQISAGEANIDVNEGQNALEAVHVMKMIQMIFKIKNKPARVEEVSMRLKKEKKK